MCGKPCERARACEIRRPRPGVVSCWIAKRGTSRPLDLIFAAALIGRRRRSVSSQDGAATAAERQRERHTQHFAPQKGGRACRGMLLLHSSHLSAAWVWLMGWIFRFLGWLLLTHHSPLAAAPPNNSNFGQQQQLRRPTSARKRRRRLAQKRRAPCGPSLTSSSSSSIGL